MLQKNVKSLLEQVKVCIFAEIVFGVRCTLSSRGTKSVNALPHKRDSKIRKERHMLGAKIQNKNNKQKEKQTEKKRRKNKNHNTNT